jgi:uncharacterized membrane protein HdeD (DUF308 family)
MKNSNSRLLAGLILLVIGAAVFAYGLIAYDSARALLGGAVHGISKFFGATSKPEQQAIIEMAAGAAVAVIGLAFLLTGRGRRR